MICIHIVHVKAASGQAGTALGSQPRLDSVLFDWLARITWAELGNARI